MRRPPRREPSRQRSALLHGANALDQGEVLILVLIIMLVFTIAPQRLPQ